MGVVRTRSHRAATVGTAPSDPRAAMIERVAHEVGKAAGLIYWSIVRVQRWIARRVR